MSREVRDIFAIYDMAANPQDAADIPQVLLRAAFLVVNHLPQDDVFRTGHISTTVGKELDRLTPSKLAVSPSNSAIENEVDFVPRCWVNDIELA